MGLLGYTEQQTRETRLALLDRAARVCERRILAGQGIFPEVPAESMSGEDVMQRMRNAFGGVAKPT